MCIRSKTAISQVKVIADKLTLYVKDASGKYITTSDFLGNGNYVTSTGSGPDREDIYSLSSLSDGPKNMSWIPLAAMLFRDSYMFSFYLYIFQSMSHVWDFHSIFYFLHQNQYTSSVQIPRKKNKLSHYGIEITGILVVFDDCSINRFVWKSDGNCQSAFV